jgi:hypothetical protein
LRQVGLLNANGSDAFYQRIVFPLRQGEHIVNFNSALTSEIKT